MTKQQETTHPPQSQRGPVFTPRVDIQESRDEIVLFADMPGVNEEDFHVTLDKNVLTIEGTVHPPDRKTHALALRQYNVGDYRRTFSISENIEQSNITANIKDGVLRLVLPKAEPSKPRVITVQAG